MLYKISEKIFELEKQGRKILKLNIGDTGIETPDAIVQAAFDSIRKGNTFYSSARGEKALLEKIAETHGCKTENVVITPGSKYGIYFLMKLILEQGANIALPSPHWTAYDLIAKEFGAEARHLKTSFERGWQFEAEDLLALADEKTKLIVLNNPNAPTSCVWPEKTVKKVIEAAEEMKILVMLDDAYKDVAFTAMKDSQYGEHVLIVNSFSKNFAMTGWRIGYLVAGKELAKKMVGLNQISVTCVPKFIQDAASAGMDQRKEITARVRDEYFARFKLAEKIFAGSKLEYVKPGAGFYLFPRVKGADGMKLTEKILEKDVAVTPGAAFGDYNEHIRIVLGRKKEILEPALQTIRQAADEF